MKIQNLSSEDIDRRSKLLRASMLYIVIFALGIVVYLSSSTSLKNNSFISQILGSYGAGTQATTNNVPADVKSALDKFATFKAPDDANLPACESFVDKANFNCGTENNKSCAQNLSACDATCKQYGKDGALSGWLRLQPCDSRSNGYFGCKAGDYTAGLVDTIAVQDFPLLDFLSQTSPANAATDSSANDAYSYTQPFCFYDMFRNFSDKSKETNPLSFGTDFTGPVYFSNNSCSAIVPYQRLGSAATCWGTNWDNYSDAAKFDVKSFYPEYWAAESNGNTGQPDTWWAQILNFFQSIFNLSIVDTSELVPVSDLTGKSVVCENLPGGGIEKFNQSKDIKSDKTYEVTRKVFDFTKTETCNMQFTGSDVRGINYCTAGGFQFFDSQLGDTIAKKRCIKDPITKKCTDQYTCSGEKTICGRTWDCDNNGSYLDAYKYCVGPANQQVTDIGEKAPNSIKYKVAKPGFDTVNLPNGNKLLRYTYDMEQLAAPELVKYGENIGIKLKTHRSLFDIEWCDGACTYGSHLNSKPDSLSFDPVANIKTGLKDYISLATDVPFNAKYPADSNLIPADTYDPAAKDKLSQSDVYYFYPYIGNIPQMLERISVYLSNQANTDTSNSLMKWLFGTDPFPVQNQIVANVALKACQDEKSGQFRKDCILIGGSASLDTPTPTPTPSTNPSPHPTIIPSNVPICGSGVDVSYANGTVNWTQARDEGKVSFAYVKAIDGTGYPNFKDADNQFYANWAGTKAAGIKRGAYIFYEPDDDGVQQADNYIDIVSKTGDMGDYILAVDVEKYDPTFDRDASTINLKRLLDRLEQVLGKKPMIYTNGAGWSALTNNPSWGGDAYPLWIASWGYDPTLPPSSASYPSGWTKYVVHQYSNEGNVPGISKSSAPRVDLDVANPSDTSYPGLNCNTSLAPNSNTLSAITNTKTTIVPTKIVATANESTVASANGSVLAVGVANNRLNDVDSLKTYLSAKIYKPYNTNLCKAQEVGTGGGPVPSVTYFPPGPTDEPNPTTPPNITYPPITLQPSACYYVADVASESNISAEAACNAVIDKVVADHPQLKKVPCRIVNEPGRSCHAMGTYIKCTNDVVNSTLGGKILGARLLFHELVHISDANGVIAGHSGDYANAAVEELKASVLEGYYYPGCQSSNYTFWDKFGRPQRPDNILKLYMGNAHLTLDQVWQFVMGSNDTFSPATPNAMPGTKQDICDVMGHGYCFGNGCSSWGNACIAN